MQGRFSSIFHHFEIEKKHYYSFEPASLRDRVVAQLIDGIILGALCSVILFILSNGNIYSIWVSPMIPEYLLEINPGYSPAWSDFLWGGGYSSLALPYGKTIYLNHPAPLFWLLYGFYYTIFTHRQGQTPGKMLKRIVVLDNQQNLLNLQKSAMRWLFYIVSIIPVGLGFWLAKKERGNQTWHDSLINSTVYSFKKGM